MFHGQPFVLAEVNDDLGGDHRFRERFRPDAYVRGFAGEGGSRDRETEN